MNEAEKQQVYDTLHAFFASPAGPDRVRVRARFFNPFALFGAPMTLFWLFLVWTLLMAPLGVVWRAGMEVDPISRLLRVRPSPGPRRMREIPLGAVAAIELSPEVGGWLGNLQARARPARKARPAQVHLHIVLRDGERVVVRNFFKISAEQMGALRDALAAAARIP